MSSKRIARFTDSAKWAAHLSVHWKRMTSWLRAQTASRPVFVFGKQRSGTSMLMYAFHRYPHALVFDEHRNSQAFVDYRIRNFETVRSIVTESRFPLVCFKPICDSHLITQFASEFPVGHFLWLYRDYRDVANSSLRKFAAPTQAIRLVCTNQPGGGWFQEGVSGNVASALRRVYRQDLSEFDLACLAWWARNAIIVESGLIGANNVTLVKYEALVSEPQGTLRWLLGRIGAPYHPRVAHNMTPTSIGRHSVPAISAPIRELCVGLMTQLDQGFQASLQPDDERLNWATAQE